MNSYVRLLTIPIIETKINTKQKQTSQKHINNLKLKLVTLFWVLFVLFVRFLFIITQNENVMNETPDTYKIRSLCCVFILFPFFYEKKG